MLPVILSVLFLLSCVGFSALVGLAMQRQKETTWTSRKKSKR